VFSNLVSIEIIVKREIETINVDKMGIV